MRKCIRYLRLWLTSGLAFMHLYHSTNDMALTLDCFNNVIIDGPLATKNFLFFLRLLSADRQTDGQTGVVTRPHA